MAVGPVEERGFRTLPNAHPQCILILPCDARERERAFSAASLAIVMSVRCTRRRDLPAVIACKHPCGGNTRTVSSLFSWQQCATSRRVNTSAHQTWRTTRTVSSRANVDDGRNFLAFYTDVHGCTRGFPLSAS